MKRTRSAIEKEPTLSGIRLTEEPSSQRSPFDEEVVSGRVSFLKDDVPVEWLDCLVRLAAELPLAQGEESVAVAFVEGLAFGIPTLAIGACLVLRDARDSAPFARAPTQRIVRASSSAGTERAGVDPARLFPGFDHEHSHELSRSGSTLHFAGIDPSLGEAGSAVDRFGQRCAAVLSRAMESSRGMSRLAELEEENQRLSAKIAQADKLASFGEIAAGLVHELNNPLTSIAAYTDYLLKKDSGRTRDPEDTERLQRIAESADRLLRFSRDLIGYARPSAERPSPMVLHGAIDQALSFCEHILLRTGAKLERHLSPDVRVIRGRHQEIVQVFVNLITNACHALPASGGRIRVVTRPSDDGLIEVSIEDNGHGIAEAHLDHVFAPFFTTKAAGEGTGLGLSIVKGIVERHGGTIRVERPERGTRFVVSLPPPTANAGSRAE